MVVYNEDCGMFDLKNGKRSKPILIEDIYDFFTLISSKLEGAIVTNPISFDNGFILSASIITTTDLTAAGCVLPFWANSLLSIDVVSINWQNRSINE